MVSPVSRIFFGRKQTVHFRGTPLPPLRKNAKFSRSCYQHILIFVNQECSYLGWTHEEPSLGAVSKKLTLAVLRNHRWQNISGSSPQFCSQPGWPQEAQSTRDINLTPALPLHHFQSKVFKFDKERASIFFANLNRLVVHYRWKNHYWLQLHVRMSFQLG